MGLIYLFLFASYPYSYYSVVELFLLFCGRTVFLRSLWPLACWYCVFESRREHGCLSLASVVCYLCVGPITRLEESYRLWCVWVWSWSLDNEEALAH